MIVQHELNQIICHLLDCKMIDIYTKQIQLDNTKKARLDDMVYRRTNGEPLQYILGETEFYGFKFKITEGIFIPRQETEILVDTVVNKLSAVSCQMSDNILDLCTGCGNIAISLTKALPRYKIFASDISEKAIALAHENSSLNDVTGCIDFRCGNLFNPWKGKGRCFFDAIVCNSPYIKTQDLDNLPMDVKTEPKDALDGGKDGLLFYKRILKDALFYIKEDGWLFFETSPDLADSVKDILMKNFINIEIVKDYNQLDRIIFAQRR